MAIYFFSKNQTLIKIVPESATFEAIQTQELDDDSLLKDTLNVTVKGDEKLLDAEYMAVKSYTGNPQTFDMYRIITDTTPDKTMSFTGMSLAPYELNGYIIQDLRPTNQTLEYTLNRVLTGTDWRLGYIEDGLSNVTTTFYYVSVKEALKELQSLVGCEFVFKVEISGQKITDKWIEVYKEMGNRTKKRFNYGTNALTVVRETNKADIYTALIGRGKGEEVSSGEDNASGQAGYGRKITFEDIEWSTAKGDPLDKPKGQYYLELPQATQTYGIKNIDGTMKARVGIVDFDDEEDKNRLINLTYQQLLVSSRPKVLFKTSVANVGATGIGDTVTIHRHDLNIHYQTRVRKIVRNKLNDNKTQVELGDAVVTPSTKRAKENNATIKNLNQEIEKVKADVTISQTSADGKNTIFYGSTEPERQRTGDTWYRPHPSLAGETQMLVWNGTAWELVIDTSDLTSVSREVQDAISKAEEAKGLAVSEADAALSQAKADATAKANAIQQQISGEVNTAISTAEDAKALAISEAGQALIDAKAHADAGVQASKEHFDGLIAATQSDVADAQATADSAVEKIDTAVANAGFTSLDETLQNMNNMTAGAEQNAQQAITDASNAYGLAQTSISEAQAAQAKSLTALGKADNALDGVSNLDIRVDDVEDELELKADNTFINEDGTLTTLSNAITFNANRFSTDMSRIESRVESLAGEINLVVLRGSIENRLLYGSEVFPNAPTYSASTNVMGELIDVVGGESFALSKELTGADDRWRIVFYDENHNFISRFHPPVNTQDIMNAPSNAKYMWVSYPKDSKPQITRGTDFIPYRPNMADQMTTDEVVMFRNEYDVFADRTERRLTSIDSSDGRLATAELLITQTAEGLALKADQNTVDTLAGTVSSLGSDFDIVAGQVSSKVWKTDIDDIEIGGRNYFSVSKLTPKPAVGVDYPNDRVYHFKLEPETEYVISTVTNLSAFRLKNGGEYYKVNFAETNDKGHKLTTDATGMISIGFWGSEVDKFINGESLFQIEKGNKATDWIPALEDNDAKIDHIETEWTQTFDTFSQTVSGIDGRVTSQKQTIDGLLGAVSSHDGRLSTVEQTASGLQSTVADKASRTQFTQLADSFSSVVGGNLLIREGEMINHWIGTDGGIEPAPARNNSAVSRHLIGVMPGEQIRFTKGNSASIDGGAFRWRYLNWNKSQSDIVRRSSFSNSFIDEVPANFYYLEVSYPYDSNPQIRKEYQSQITQLANNINLRVSKGDVINQINVSTEGILIDGKKTHITGTTTIDDGVIKNAHIAELNADKITSGTIDAARLNAKKIVTDGLDTNVVKSEHILSSAALIDKIFANEALITRLTSNTIFASKIKAIEIDASKIISGELDAARIKSKDVVTAGLSANVVEATHIKAEAGLVGKLFSTTAYIEELTNKTVFTEKIQAINISADKITTGTLDAGKVKVVNIDANNITANKTAFVRTAWNDISSEVAIDGSGIKTQNTNGDFSRIVSGELRSYNADSSSTAILGSGRSQYFDKAGSQFILGNTLHGTEWVNSGTLQVAHNRRFAIGRYADYAVNNGNLHPYISLEYAPDKPGDETNGVVRLYKAVHLQKGIYAGNNDISGLGKISFHNGGRIVSQANTSNLLIEASNKMVAYAVGTNAFEIDSGYMYLKRNLSMEGNNITNQSDRRLKTNIVDTPVNSLSAISNWGFKAFDRVNNGNHDDIGLIAQDTSEIVVYDEENDIYNVNSSKQIMMNSHAIQQLNTKVDDEISKLKAQIASLQDELALLKGA